MSCLFSLSVFSKAWVKFRVVYQLFLCHSYLWQIQDLKFSPVLSCIDFAVNLGLWFIWVNFLMWGTISFLQMAFQMLQYHLLNRLFFSPTSVLASFLKINWLYFWTLPSVPLMYMDIFMPILYNKFKSLSLYEIPIKPFFLPPYLTLPTGSPDHSQAHFSSKQIWFQ